MSKRPTKRTYQRNPGTIIYTKAGRAWRLITAMLAGIVLLGGALTALPSVTVYAPATRGWTSEHVDEKITPLDGRLTVSDVVGLKNRIEILDSKRERAIGERFDLELKQRTVKDPAAQQIIQRRIQTIDQNIKAIDDDVVESKTTIKSLENKRR